jgi:hypothetical protein
MKFWLIFTLILAINSLFAQTHHCKLDDFNCETVFTTIPTFNPYTSNGFPYKNVSDDNYQFLLSGKIKNLSSYPINARLKLEVFEQNSLVLTMLGPYHFVSSNDSLSDTLLYQIPSGTSQYQFNLSVDHDSLYLDTLFEYSDSTTLSVGNFNTTGLQFSKTNGENSGNHELGLLNGFYYLTHSLVATYKFIEDVELCTMDIQFSERSNIGALVRPQIYEIGSQGNFQLIYQGTIQSIDSNYHVHFPIENNGSIMWQADKFYLFGYETGYTNDTAIVAYGTQSDHIYNQSFYFEYSAISPGWAVCSGLPMIDLYGPLACLVGLDESVAHELNLHPNPSSNNIHLNWEATFEAKTYAITSLEGKLVKQGKIAPTLHELNLDCSHLNNGLYNITLNGLTGPVSKQFVIAK